MTPVRSPDDLDDARALAEALRPLLHRLIRQLRRESGDFGVSLLQLQLLIAIVKNPGIGTAELARQEQVRGPTMSGHIKAMEAAGLVSRTAPAPDDRRRVGLIATDKGRNLLKVMKRRRTDWLAQKLGDLPREARRAVRDAIGPLSELVQ
ncbi:MAG: MarR family transcriptional regulator [Pseudomonadota bacterium]